MMHRQRFGVLMALVGLVVGVPDAWSWTGERHGSGPGQGRVTTVAKVDSGTGGVELDAQGNVYNADFGSALGPQGRPGTRVWRITPGGKATVFAEGFAGASGNAFDADGNLFQANIRGKTISRITPDGTVSLYADKGLENPVGVVVTSDGTLFAANCGSASIQRIDVDGTSSRVAESELLACPNGLTRDEKGNLYASNFYNGDVVKVTPKGEVSRLATLPGGNNGHLVYAGGRLYVVDRGGHQIFAVTLKGEFSVVAGSGERGNQDGTALEASFCFPNDLAITSDGRTLYINEVADCTEDGRKLAPTLIRKVAL